MAEAPASGPAAVTIFGRTYHLRGGDQDHLAELAEVVDGRMREIAEDGSISIDTICAEALGVGAGDEVWSVAR